MINRGLLLVFLLLLTLVGFISCGQDEEVPQEASLAEVSDDLVAAVRQGNVSLVTEIISDNPERVSDILNTRLSAAGADAGLTPLMIAARDIDNAELVKLLINNGADASITTDPQGWTALLYALAFNKSDAVTEEVLKADNPNKDQKLAVAYQPTDADVLRKTPLRSGKNAGYVPAGATGLILATFISDGKQALSKVKLLTTSGVDLEAGDKDGRKATLYASVHHNAEVVSALVGAGADVKGLKDASGNTVLAHVVEHGVDVDVVDALVGAGLPVDEENKEGYTGLQWAAQKGGPKSADFISKLLAKGADVNKANAQQGGRTALIFAVQSGNVAAVKALLHAEDIELEKADATGKTALAYAAENAEIAALIAAKSPPLPSLTIAPTALSFTATGVAQTVTVTLSNADSWAVGTPTYTDGAGWLTATPGTGADANTLTVTVGENTGTTDRSGSVALTPAQGSTTGDAVTLSVTQTSPPSLSVAPTSLSFTTTAAGTETVAVELSNADSWSVGDITYTEGADWLTAAPSSANANVLEVTVIENTDTSPRRGSVALTPTASGTNGEVVTLSVTQAGTAPSLTVSPTELSFTATEIAAKTVVVTLYSADTWSVGDITYTEGAGWITATKDANTLTVTVEENTAITDRSGSIVFTPTASGTNGEVVTLSVTQTGTAPRLSVDPTGLSFTSSETGPKTVAVTLSYANSWSVGALAPSAAWITATKDANTLTVTVDANTGADRSGSVTLTPAQDGTTGTAVVLEITQTSPPRLTVDPTALFFTATETEAKTVVVTLYSADTWSVGDITYKHGDGWITAKQGTGAAANTLEVTVDAHTGTEGRGGSVSLVPAGGEAVSLLVGQNRLGPSLALFSTYLFFRASETDTRSIVVRLANAATSWSVGDITYTDGDGWIRAAQSTTNTNILEVTLEENVGTDDRAGSVVLTPDQGDAVTLRILQTPPPSLTIDLPLNFTAAGGTARVGVELIYADDWEAFGPAWITISEDTDNSLILVVTVGENTGAIRSGDITLTPIEENVNGAQVKLPVTQDGAGPTLSLEPTSLSSTNPATLSFTASETDTRRVTILLLNADSWAVTTVSTTDDADWLTATKSSTDDDILDVTVTAHAGTTDRSGNIVLTPAQGSTTGTTVSLRVVQELPPPTLSLEPTSLSSTNPATLSFTASETDTRRVTILLLNADSWAVTTVSTTDDADWLTATKSSTDDDILDVTVTAHAGTTDRTGNIVLTPAQGSTTGTTVSLRVVQELPPPTLSLDASSLSSTNPATLSFTATETDPKEVTITLLHADSWAVTAVTTTDNVNWLTATPTQGTVDANTLTVTVPANTGADTRSGSVVLTPAQDGTAGTAVSLLVTQTSPPRLTLDTEGLSFTEAGSTKRVAVELFSADSWTVSSVVPPDSWLTATKSNTDDDILEVTVTENTGADTRSGSVVLTPAQGNVNGSAVRLSVTQVGTAPRLTVAPTSLEFTASETGPKTVDIMLFYADTWTVSATTYTEGSGSGWITATKDGNVLTVTVPAYTGTTDRSGSVELTPAQDGTAGSVVTLSVIQTSPPRLSLDPTSLSSLDPPSLDFTAAAGTKAVAVTLYNADTWTVSPPNSWLRATKNGNTLTVTVKENAGTAARSGSVVLTPIRTVSGGTDITGTPVSLTINQAVLAFGLFFTPASLSVPAGRSTIKVAVTLHNVTSWGVNREPTWISTVESENTITVFVFENTGTAARTGNITLTYSRYSERGSTTLLVTQAAAEN